MTEKTVLFVDDETMITDLYSDTFRGFGYKTWEAANYEEAMLLFRKHKPILVLIDLILNDNIGGVNCCKSIKDIQPLTIAVAVSGAFEGSYTISHLRRQGMDHFIEKPALNDTFKFVADVAFAARSRWDSIIGGMQNGPN